MVDGRVFGAGIEGKIMPLSECPQRDEQWVRVRTETGITGWELLDQAEFLGISVPMSATPPRWAKSFLARMDATAQLAITLDEVPKTQTGSPAPTRLEEIQKALPYISYTRGY